MQRHGWFHVQTIGPGVTMIEEPGHEEDVKSYLIEGDHDIAVLDTGMGVGDFHGLVTSISHKNPVVLQSHAHWDHVGDSAKFNRVLIHHTEETRLAQKHPNEELKLWFTPDKLRGVPFPSEFDLETVMIAGTRATGRLQHGDCIDLGNRELEIYHTPGHSPGGITILDRSSRLLFPGDAVNIGPIYLFSSDADPIAYRQSLKLLVELTEDIDLIYPSHYTVPMRPDQLIAVAEAYDDILAGREMDDLLDDREVYNFDWFTFWIRPGAVQMLREKENE